MVFSDCLATEVKPLKKNAVARRVWHRKPAHNDAARGWVITRRSLHTCTRISESLLCAAACPLHSFSGRLCGRNALRACAGDTMETTETATAENQRDLGKKRGRRSSVRECEVSDVPRKRWCGLKPFSNRGAHAHTGLCVACAGVPAVYAGRYQHTTLSTFACRAGPFSCRLTLAKLEKK